MLAGTDLLIQIKERGAVPRYVVSLRDVPEVRQVTYDATLPGSASGPGPASAESRRTRWCRALPHPGAGASLVGSLQIPESGHGGGQPVQRAPSADCARPWWPWRPTCESPGGAGRRGLTGAGWGVRSYGGLSSAARGAPCPDSEG